MKHATRWLVPCCLATACLAACSGDDEALPTEPPVEPRETTTTSTAAAPTTAAGETTLPSTTDPRSAATDSTMFRPPTMPPTTEPADPEADAALAAVDAYYVAWRECLRSLPACDPVVFEAFAAPSVATALAEQVRGEQAAFHEAENVDSYGYGTIGVERLDGRIVVTVCQRDGIVVYERPPGGAERLVTDAFVSKVREWHVDPTADGWRIVGSTTLEEAIGMENDLCAG